jgi:hypothetical protein
MTHPRRVVSFILLATTVTLPQLMRQIAYSFPAGQWRDAQPVGQTTGRLKWNAGRPVA